MSHNATNWAIRQRGLKPATKLVLWHLCDRHNPDQGCFPSQDKLAHDCEMSRSSLNEHLKILEKKGLIRRDQRVNETTKRQQSTSYIFAFEEGFVCASQNMPTPHVVEPCPETGHGAVSGKIPEPCPENDKSRVQNPDTNLVREPVREPSEARERAGGGAFSKFWNDWSEVHRPDKREAAEAVFLKLSESDQIAAVEHAGEYQRLQVLRSKPALMFPYLRNRLFADLINAPPTDHDGEFIITPDRPEWSEWLGEMRRRHGEPIAQGIVRQKKIIVKTRWPVRHTKAA
ncbi:hypothetical protein J2X72_001150 [Phyllobacterium sp. 1468]|uniref:helix-turn-helix domain-containing protein n=1 Tax=Phyllobacterium sp. 1468 TaxID=2817759 RepID=UPI0028582B9B|nr:helix-turn-helix domain-containing protein [Phyllobacterium sp. 1468]MDR6632366.1 hypothetical protein [Phyllobacterium sp. 1468]